MRWSSAKRVRLRWRTAVANPLWRIADAETLRLPPGDHLFDVALRDALLLCAPLAGVEYFRMQFQQQSAGRGFAA